MQILEAFDLPGSLRDAAALAGCSHHTVARYVEAHEAGGQLDVPAVRPQLIDEFQATAPSLLPHDEARKQAPPSRMPLDRSSRTGALYSPPDVENCRDPPS